MKIFKLPVLATIILLTSGCKKDFPALPASTQPVVMALGKIFKTPSTPEEKLLVENLGKLTEILKELYKDKINLKTVNAAIFSKAYTDESIVLKDLIYPDKSRLNSSDKFKFYSQKWDLNLSRFSANFWNEVNKKNDPPFLKFLNGLHMANEITTDSHTGNLTNSARPGGYNLDITIYFPYSEEFIPETGSGTTYDPITTIVTATADADEGWGIQPYYKNGVFQSYTNVLVNDDYVYNNPTQIVGVNGVEPYDSYPVINTAFPPENPIDLANLPREVKQVYVGDVKIHGLQYDKLISFTGNGGGSEIRFTRADGYLKVVDGQVQTADVYFTQAKVVSRYNIKKKNWVDVSYEWDGDWELANLQQNLGIYEEDNRNASTFTGSLSTTVTATVAPVAVTGVRTLGFTINYKSDDELIRQINFNRDVFFILNRTNLGGGMYNGWPIRDPSGPVSYTLNDRTYY